MSLKYEPTSEPLHISVVPARTPWKMRPQRRRSKISYGILTLIRPPNQMQQPSKGPSVVPARTPRRRRSVARRKGWKRARGGVRARPSRRSAPTPVPYQGFSILHINVQRFREGLALKAHRVVYHSTLGLRVIRDTSAMPEGCTAAKRSAKPALRFGSGLRCGLVFKAHRLVYHSA